MTVNKRFTLTEYDFWENGEPISSEDVCHLLNNYHEQIIAQGIVIEGYQGRNKHLFDKNKQLKIKNKGLQSELQIFKEDVKNSNSTINHLTDENEQLEKENKELEQITSQFKLGDIINLKTANEIINEQRETIKEFIKENAELKEENKQLKTTIEELRAYDERDYIETEHINNIYKEFGFDGVIEEVKGRLVCGTVTEMDNLVRISTGGWSDDEALLDVLISPMTRFHYHYVGYLVGGAFYFDKDKSFESFMKIRLIKDLENGDV